MSAAPPSAAPRPGERRARLDPSSSPPTLGLGHPAQTPSLASSLALSARPTRLAGHLLPPLRQVQLTCLLTFTCRQSRLPPPSLRPWRQWTTLPCAHVTFMKSYLIYSPTLSCLTAPNHRFGTNDPQTPLPQLVSTCPSIIPCCHQ